MKILIIQHKMIGDVLITSLLCENIKKAYPNAIVDYLINSNTLPVLENNPYIDHKIVFDEKENKGLMNLIKFSKKVNQNKYDVVIDAYSKLQSWVDVFINNAQKKISYKKIGRTFLYTDNVEKHDEPIEIKGYVPARSVVIPGSYTKKFAAGEYQVPCALIIGTRKESTDKKTSLNDALREHNVAV